MLSLNVHVRQDLGDWTLSAVLVESYGAGLDDDVTMTSWSSPLTGPEWEMDPLEATMSAILRWSGLTTERNRLQP